ncbi:DUF1266 domain-containing protein [Streptomyces abikoensis]|uniref:DUF1266 domain-containing protein n=1 Tax=Streptomyces abikoensis TaxID=97398 RepID=UPI003722839A
MGIWNEPAGNTPVTGAQLGGRPAGLPPMPASPPWQAPTDVEQGLYQARTRGDWAAYFDVLAATKLYHSMPREVADQLDGRVQRSSYWEPRTGTYCYAFWTHGMLPVPVPDQVFFRGGLGWIAEEWARSDVMLAVNPGTPCEAFFSATPAHRDIWQEHARRAPTDKGGVLRTLRVGGPLEGEVARGLACGALLCVSNGSIWNAMGWHGTGYVSERERLKEWWGITSHDDWKAAQESLLQGTSGSVWEFVLEIRRTLSRQYGGLIDVAHWRQATERVMRHNMERVGGDESGTADRADDLEAEVRRVQQLIGRITRYEARFRADGLLGEGKQVRSTLSWNFGRASKMARWGLGARYCDLEEAEWAVIRAGRVSRVNYKSWEDFSVGYILGRCLHFDEEEFGSWYQDMLDAHRILMTAPESPWVTIPWK